MAKVVTLKDHKDETIVYPQTLMKCVQNDAGKTLDSLVLTKDNTTEFIPSTDYQPATKKYVDENSGMGTVSYLKDQALTNEEQTLGRANINAQEKISVNGILQSDGSGNVTAVQETLVELVDMPHVVNPNLLDNWYFIDPINQQTKTTYNSVGYTIDRWKITVAGVTVDLTDDGILISGINNRAFSPLFVQGVEHYKQLAGKQLTCSILFDSVDATNSFYIRMNNGSSFFTDASGSGLVYGTITVPLDITKFELVLCSTNVDTAFTGKILAVKLELGDQQTLAHQDADGNWVLNEIPNYGIELLKCQRHCTPINSWTRVRMSYYNANNMYFIVPTPVGMRSKPILSDPTNSLQIVGLNADSEETGFTFSVSSLLAGAVLIVATKTGHGLTDGQLVKRGGSNYSLALLSANL